MKIFTKFFFILVLSLQLNVFPQIPNTGNPIPNGSFEDWLDPSTPNGWFTNNAPPAYTPITRTSVAAMGTYAVQLLVSNSAIGPIPPFMQTDFFMVDQSYGSVMGYYQFYPASSSEVLYLVVLFVDDGNLIGSGAIDIYTPTSTYTQFNFGIEYFGFRSVPDSAYMWIGITDTTGTFTQGGGYAYIDELTFGPPVGVNPVSSSIPDNFSLMQNYPNPFNPSTKINFSLPEQSYIELTVYDILGNKITELISDTYSAGEYSVDFIADNLPAGVYLARLSAGKYSNTIKMTLLE
jgi:hypothetical protein